LALREQSQLFESICAFTSAEVALATSASATPKPVLGLFIADDCIETLRLYPTAGRMLGAQDHRPASSAVVLTHEFWLRAFGSDEAAVGAMVSLNGVPAPVVGVGPRGFGGLDLFTTHQFLAPLQALPALTDGSVEPLPSALGTRRVFAKARLHPLMTMASARARLAALSTELGQSRALVADGTGLRLLSEFESRLAGSSLNATLVATLSVLAVFVTLIALLNCTSLVSHMIREKARDVAIESALGATAWHTGRRVVLELGLVTLAASAIAVALVWTGVSLFSRYETPTEVLVRVTFRFDHRCLWASAICVVIPAIGAYAPYVWPSARSIRRLDNTRSAVALDLRVSAALIAVQGGVAFLLVAVAAFLWRDFAARIKEGPGFATDARLVAWLPLAAVEGEWTSTLTQLTALRDEVSQLPGVTAVSLTSFLPLDGGVRPVAVIPEDTRADSAGEAVTVFSASVDGAFFRTLGIPATKGRALRDDDGVPPGSVAVVNEWFASRVWPGRNPIGRRFFVGGNRREAFQVVGVARTSKYVFMIEAPTPFIYFPLRSTLQRRVALVLESERPALEMAAPVNAVIAGSALSQSQYTVRDWSRVYYLRGLNVLSILIAYVVGLAGCGLCLATIGMFAVQARWVQARAEEFAIRQILGASQRDIIWRSARTGLTSVATGAVLGGIGYVVAHRVLLRRLPSTFDNERAWIPFVVALAAISVSLVASVAAQCRCDAQRTSSRRT